MRQPLYYEIRKYFVVAGQSSRQRVDPVVAVQHHADRQEQHKLEQNDDSAEYNCLLAITLGPASQQSLDKQLIRAMRSHRQECSAQQPCPERERQSRMEAEGHNVEV